jgi:glycine cleavage system H protein
MSNGNDYPDDLLFTKEHEWVRVEGTRATIGITAFAVGQLNDVTLVELPGEGETLNKDQVFGSVESVKSVSDLFAPVSGTITKVNTPLSDSPEYVNEAPYEDGWMIEIEMTKPEELGLLLDAKAYRAYVAEEEG